MNMRIDPHRVRQFRHARYWSQDQLAEACGLNLRTIQRLESTGRASKETVRAIAAVLEIEIESFLAPADSSNEAASRSLDDPRTVRSAVINSLLRFDDFSGRAGRFDYWWFMLAASLVLAAGALLHPMLHAFIALAIIVPMLAAGTRRLRDAGESPWWQLMWLVPIAGLLVLWMQTRPSVENVDSPPGPGSLPTPPANR